MSEELLLAILAFAGAFAGGLCTLVANRKNLSVQFITDKRVDWIYEVRNTLAEYIGLTQECEKNLASYKKLPEKLERELNVYLAKLRLLFNYAGEEDRKVLEVIECIHRSVSGGDVPKEEALDLQIERLTKLSQQYLKLEWERVKYETRGKESFRAGERWKKRKKEIEGRMRG